MRLRFIPVECVLGPNWIVTAYRQRIEVLDEFFERAQGGGQIGALDAPSFVATILDWIVASYLRALDAVESELEELDAKVMSNTPKEAADDLTRLVELRRTIGTLRRALSPPPRSGRFAVTPRTRFALERGISAAFRRA